MLPALLIIAAAHGSLHFIDDDYPKALATARAQHQAALRRFLGHLVPFVPVECSGT